MVHIHAQRNAAAVLTPAQQLHMLYQNCGTPTCQSGPLWTTFQLRLASTYRISVESGSDAVEYKSLTEPACN